MLKNYTFLCELFYNNISVHQIIYRHKLFTKLKK